jgi:hypothetical protein
MSPAPDPPTMNPPATPLQAMLPPTPDPPAPQQQDAPRPAPLPPAILQPTARSPMVHLPARPHEPQVWRAGSRERAGEE